jgi:signal peptidase I
VETQQEETQNQVKVKNFFMDMVQTILIALGISIFIYVVIAIPNQVDGKSMEPNFHHGELLLTNKIVHWFGNSQLASTLKIDIDYKRGDVVIFNSKGTDLIKRIIASEGDSIKIQDNYVYINGNLLDEKYLPTTTRTRLPSAFQSTLAEGEESIVPNNTFFLMGDNRENSKDSRFSEVGFINRDNLRGRVFFRYWPLNNFGIIRAGEFEEIQTF